MKQMGVDSNAFEWQPFLRQMMACSPQWGFYFMFGVVLGTPTVTVPQLRQTAPVSDEMASWISSMVGYMGMIWAVLLSLSAYKYGVKRTIMIQLVAVYTADLTLFFSQNAMHVLISQVLNGPIAATQTTTAILVLTEYTTPRYRGLFLTLKSATLFWGIWAANAMGIFIPYRYIACLGIAVNTYILVIQMIVPESPLWLAKKGRYVECAKSHRWLKGVSGAAEKELEVLITTEKVNRSCINPQKTLLQQIRDYTTILSQPDVYKPLALCCLLHAMYHMSGKLMLTVYSIDIIKKITNSQSTAHIGMLILDGFTVLGMYLGCGLSKILKRRSLLLGASSIATTFLYIIAIYLYLVRLGVIYENGYVSVALMMSFSLVIACGPLIMASSISGELIPVRSRMFCLCLVAFFTKLILGVVLKIAPLIIKSFGTDGTFLYFAVVSTIIILLTYKFLPETKDKTLIEISEYFRKDKMTASEIVSLTKDNVKT